MQLEALARFQNEQRSIEYVKLSAAQAGTIDPPSPEALAAYFDEHKALFRAPEYRKISFVADYAGGNRQVGQTSPTTTREKVFEQRRDQLGTPERREIQQIISRTRTKPPPHAAASHRARRLKTSPRNGVSVRPTSTSA